MSTVHKLVLLGFLGWSPSGLADEPRPAVILRLDHPDRQARAVIDLFRGSRAANPAAALTAWKRASREPGLLGKPLEAVLAAINPAMAEELRTLDGAELALWFDPEGRAAWGATFPADDGSFEALATAAVLSGGAVEGAIDGLAVDRLGPPGSALMARAPRALLVAGSLESLKEARARSERPSDRSAGDRLRFAVDPRALDGSKSLLVQRLRAILREVRGSESGEAGLVGSTFDVSIAVGIPRPARPAGVDPAWLDWLPVDRAMLAFAVAIDPSPANWDATFRLVDLVEKVDPAREAVAPARLRLDLLARTLGLRLDGELLPHLRGMAGWLGGDGRSVDRAFLVLHLDDEAIAGQVGDRARPLPNSGPPPAGPNLQPGRWLGQIDGRSVRVHRSGRSVVTTWGDGVMDALTSARDHPERSARTLFRDRPVDSPPAFFAAIWPVRVPGLIPVDTPLAVAVGEGPPIVCSGAWRDAHSFRMVANWGGLDVTIGRFLDRITLDPPPDH